MKFEIEFISLFVEVVMKSDRNVTYLFISAVVKQFFLGRRKRELLRYPFSILSNCKLRGTVSAGADVSNVA
jgi:hypothetical protein